MMNTEGSTIHPTHTRAVDGPCACLLCRALIRRLDDARPEGPAKRTLKRAAGLVLSVVAEVTPGRRGASRVEVLSRRR
ncbi:hypothetical protein L6R52_07825 [Myxococcota bacterium]|nr:hypothetical protein [Myxococcota bacterium]